jgi:hypothetical protein
MKSAHALIVAAFLGILGAVFNYAYLSSRAARDATLEFIVIKKGATVAHGERLNADSATGNIDKMEIPEAHVGRLKDVAILWENRQTVDGMPVWRTLGEGDFVFREDVKTPPPELDLGQDEDAIWVPVGGTAYVPSLIVPGESTVSFRVPVLPAGSRSDLPPVADSARRPEADENQPTLAGPTEEIGPFKVLSVGNRLGSAEVMRAAKIPQLQENVLTIRVNKKEAGEVERAKTLWNRLQAINFRQVGIVLHSRKPDTKGK